MQIKVQELIYLLFLKFSLRESTPHQIINSADAERLLFVRNEIIRDLSILPVVRELAKIAATSETKLKLLVKQTFDNTLQLLSASQNGRSRIPAQTRQTISRAGRMRIGFFESQPLQQTV